jgi:fimbrial isopeptide formation D2 family protein/uncharacterized repeat protein (TIGR01451 family)
LGHFRSLEAVFGLLEPRILLAAQPVVEVSDAKPFIGDSGSFTVTMRNVDDGTGGGRTGFQPYVDLIIPHTGADGKVTAPTSLPLDGVTVTSASLFGAAIDPQVVTFDAAGNATHPFARDGTGSLRVVKASDFGKDSLGNNLVKPGDQLVVLDLPFGSLVPEQPEMTITVNFSLSNHADLGVALPVFAQGGFAFGRDPLDNPTAVPPAIPDPPVLGTFKKGEITPSLFTLSKSYNGPEGETATGPNFQRSFDLKFDVATGQNVLNPVFKDTLPEGVVVVGTPTMSVPGSVVYNPVSREVTFTPNGPLTGVAGTDVTGTINFYASTVLNQTTGAPVTLGNDLSGSLRWIPIDPRDRVLDPVTGLPTPILFTQDPSGPEASFDAKSIATQKGVALFTDVGATGVGPGDTLKYTINIQVSDYFEFQNLKIQDILSDGQTFVAGSARLTATEAGSTTGVDFESPNITAVETAGVTTLDLNISGQLGGDGVLTGGLFPTGLTNQGATTLQITYLTTIDTRFNNNTVVSQGDSVSNSVTVQGDIRDAAGVVTQSDGSGSSIGIATGSLSKEVYAINNVILTGSTSDVKVKTYDLVTYRLTYNLPQSILGKLEFTDFLPLPIFDADVFVGTSLQIPGSSSSLPGENTIQYGPSSFSSSFMSVTNNAKPAISVDSDANSFGFVFTNLNPSPTVATIADFLFTVRVADDPFGDGLKLTNQVTSQEYKHGDIKSVFSTAIKQITLTEPDLRITKGVIQTNNDGGTFTLASQGPVTFTEPGGSAPRFTGTINSTNLTTAPINSDLNNIDGRDLVSFGIVVENKGSSTGGAFDVKITDTMPVGFSIPTLGPGLNLRVTDGAGTALAYTLGSGGFFIGGLTLDDGTTGALKPYHATNGQNIVIITYDLLSDDFVQPKQVMKNTANVINYAAREDGSNYITERGPLKDDATVTTAIPLADKVAIETSLTQTGKIAGNQNLFDLAIGESITYEITATLPEGNIKGFNILDVLEQSPQKLTYLNASVVSIGGNLFSNSALTTALASTGISHSNGTINFGFPTDVYNKADGSVTDADKIRVRVTAYAADVAGNVAGQIVTNTGIIQYNEASGTQKTVQDTEDAEIVEPKLQINKAVTAPNGFVKPGETVDYTVTVSHLSTSTAPAFDLKVEDLISDPYLALVAGSVSINRGSVVSGNGAGDTRLSVTADELLRNDPLAAGDVWTISFKAKVLPTTPGGVTINNTATSSFDSAPGDGGRPDGGSAAASIPGSPSLEKTIISTSNPDTGSSYFDPTLPDLTIGEKLTYRMVMTLPQGLTQNVSITDLLPAGLTPLEARLVSLGSLSAGTPAISISGQTVTVTFGNVTNSTGAPIGAEDRITIDVDARVKDLPGLVAGNKLTNAAQADFKIGDRTSSLIAAASAEVVEAKLVIDKQVTPTTVTLGETFTYSVILSHEAASTAPAYNVVVKDLLSDPNLRLQSGSVFASAGLVSTGNAPGDQNIKIDLAKLMPGELLRVSFQAKIETMPLPNGLVSNTATFGFVSTPDTLPSTFIRSGSGSDSADVQVATPSLRPSDQSPLSSYQETFKRIRHGYWELPIVLAGTAEPGAAVGIEIRDATGAPVSVVGITADVGGHWMAPPIFTSAMPAQDLDALASLRSLAGRHTAPAGETPLSQPLPSAWLPTTTSAPYTVVTSEAGPAFMKEGFKRNMDVTFNGVVDSEGAVTSDAAQAFMIEKSASSTWSNRPSSAPPGSLVWNSFARDFAINRQLGR